MPGVHLETEINMIKAIIVDDERNNRENLLNLLSKHCSHVNMVGQANSVDSAIQLIHDQKPNLVFLDIKMPEKDGFELLKAVSEINFEVIFVTAYNEYAIQAIKICAIDYLLKPINTPELIKAVQKVENKITKDFTNKAFHHYISNTQANSSKKIALPTHEQVDFVDINNIIRLEGENNYTHVFLSNNSRKLISKTLKEFENLLSDLGFVRIHRSHLVNANHIETYLKNDGGYIVLNNGHRLPISRNRKAEILEKINRLM